MFALRSTIVPAVLVALASAWTQRAGAQAACVDRTGLACLATVGGGVDDIFQTSDGRFAPELTFGTYIPGRGVSCCETTDSTVLTSYVCTIPAGPTTPTGDGRCLPTAVHPMAARYANSLDWLWTHTQRLNDSCVPVTNGTAGFYYPWRGRRYDLGAEANRVVLFPITDHGPLPCEAFEYSVYLSNNPDALELAAMGSPDPNKWNPALMIRAYNQGWTRNPNALGAAEAGRADLATFLRDNSTGEAVADSTVTVWALPCGITFRYASIVAGNYGNPGPECVFHSDDDELDAVAGLNEDDTAICVDADMDGHRDAACGGTDCDDADPAVHPGAFEACDVTRDLDCAPARPCPTGTTCDPNSGVCVPDCFEFGCAAGFDCVLGRCVDPACASLPAPCAAGTVCVAGACVDPCASATCPVGTRCLGGTCVDPCAGVVCPTNQVCIARDPAALTVCGPSCTCTDLVVPLCPAATTCDARPGSATEGQCVEPGCETIVCAASETCVAGACVDRCVGVTCPFAHVCMAGRCEVDLCARVRCPPGLFCMDGACIDACTGVTCATGEVCRSGACVDACAGVTCPAMEVCMGGVCLFRPSDGGTVGIDGGMPLGRPEQGACCRIAGHNDEAPPLLWTFALAVALVLRSRRPSRRRAPRSAQ